jgi:hypothetical protein
MLSYSQLYNASGVMACKSVLLHPNPYVYYISALQGVYKYSDRTRINQIILFIKSII